MKYAYGCGDGVGPLLCFQACNSHSNINQLFDPTIHQHVHGQTCWSLIKRNHL